MADLTKPLLSDPKAPSPPRIIPSLEKSRPPVYSAELKALLTSPLSRPGKSLDLQHLVSPPALPDRANPLSEEARLLGPFSKRREKNIRWRFFATEWKKTLPPLEATVEVQAPEGIQRSNKTEDLDRAGIRGFGMQGSTVSEDIDTLVGPGWIPKTPTRRGRTSEDTTEVTSHSRHPSRWVRRRYQQLLKRLPILTFARREDADGRVSEKYSVSLHANTLDSPSSLAEVDANDLAWVARGETKNSLRAARSTVKTNVAINR